MDKTDVDGVYAVRPGIFVMNKNDNYSVLRAKEIERQQQTNKINALEEKMSSIEQMLKQILEKVN